MRRRRGNDQTKIFSKAEPHEHKAVASTACIHNSWSDSRAGRHSAGVDTDAGGSRRDCAAPGRGHLACAGVNRYYQRRRNARTSHRVSLWVYGATRRFPGGGCAMRIPQGGWEEGVHRWPDQRSSDGSLIETLELREGVTLVLSSFDGGDGCAFHHVEAAEAPVFLRKQRRFKQRPLMCGQESRRALRNRNSLCQRLDFARLPCALLPRRRERYLIRTREAST